MSVKTPVNVTTSPDILGRNRSIPASVAEHRVEYWTWVAEHADTHMRDTLIGLRDHWQESNARFFDGRMLLPYITLTEPSAPRIYGQCCPRSSWGSRMEIRLRPSLLTGTHPHLEVPYIPDPEYSDSVTPDWVAWEEGRVTFVRDVLLHEMIHQHVMEHEPDVNENSYHGHGPVFTEHANRIGAVLGLPEVVVRNRGGKVIPKAAQWPHCVAPPDRYRDVYQPKRPRVTARGVVVPEGYTVSAIGPVDGTSLLDIEFDTDSGDKPTMQIRIAADTASELADFLRDYLDGDGDR